MKLQKIEKILSITLLIAYILTYHYAFPIWNLGDVFYESIDSCVIGIMLTMIFFGIAFAIAMSVYYIVCRNCSKKNLRIIIVLLLLEVINIFLATKMLRNSNEYAEKYGLQIGMRYISRANIFLIIIGGLVIGLIIVEVSNFLKMQKSSNTAENYKKNRFDILFQIINIALGILIFIFLYYDGFTGLFFESLLAICVPIFVWYLIVVNRIVGQGKRGPMLFGNLGSMIIVKNMVYHVFNATFSGKEMVKVVENYVTVLVIVTVVEIILIAIEFAVKKATYLDDEEKNKESYLYSIER